MSLEPLMNAQNLFSHIGQSKIFKNRAVLVSDFVPVHLPHRETEIKRLVQILSPALWQSRPNNVFIYGLTGTGKTAVVRHVLGMLAEESKRRNVDVGIVYINAKKDDTSYRVLFQIGRQLNLNLPFTGLSVSEVYFRIVDHMEKLKKVVIISIDEIDYLVRDTNSNLLYKLTRINSDLSNSQVTLIGITNDTKALEYLDPRVKSSLGEEELVFAPYNADQLKDILYSRCNDAFFENVLEENVVPYIAALAAKDHGDARKAVDLLRKAGEVAEREGRDKVSTEDVKEALKEIEVDTALEVVTKLPLHSKIILASIAELSRTKKIVVTGDILLKYTLLCNKLGLEVLTPRRVSEIINELDMVGIISTKILNRGRYGRTKRIALNVEVDNIWKAFKKDDLLNSLYQ
jgi:cell division control protein 6